MSFSSFMGCILMSLGSFMDVFSCPWASRDVFILNLCEKRFFFGFLINFFALNICNRLSGYVIVVLLTKRGYMCKSVYRYYIYEHETCELGIWIMWIGYMNIWMYRSDWKIFSSLKSCCTTTHLYYLSLSYHIYFE